MASVDGTTTSACLLHRAPVYRRPTCPPPTPRVTRETLLREKLLTLIDKTVERMLDLATVEPGLLRIVGDATAALAAIDRKQSKVIHAKDNPTRLLPIAVFSYRYRVPCSI